MGKDNERQNEIERDDATRFLAEQYVSKGYYMHFHRNMEIYGVVQGRVAVTIDGQQNILTGGQIAIVDGLENHSYEIEGEAEVFYFHIGTRYLSNFRTLYPQKRLPHWLMDAQYNQVIYQQIVPLLQKTAKIPELKRIGMICQMFSDIIEHYGTIEKLGNIRENKDVATRVVQYIYDHYQENITLETLSKQFYLSPKALSKKLKKHINMDLRVFINDIRVQRAVEMLDDPKNYGKSINQIATQCGFSSMATFYRSYERNYSFRKLGE
jgi:AraC-like DNA-binding protein/mannose-6-phosphate isomerase-like protein (cupin superfamily)